MKPVRAKKSLGQHFLKDLSVAERIATSLSSFDLPLLEVGPGMGVLTQYLTRIYKDLKAVEVDEESITYLLGTYPELKEKLLYDDFLKLDLGLVFDGAPYMVIGNYPYNISSQIFFRILEYKDLIPAAAGMLQREVALRLASPPGNKDYGILSVLLQAWYDVEYLFTVDEQAFAPPPKVKSGVIRLTRNSRESLGCDEKLFKAVVKTTFNRRRKTLRNSLRPLLGDLPLPSKAEKYASLRPERLSVEDFIVLTQIVGELLEASKS